MKTQSLKKLCIAVVMTAGIAVGGYGCMQHDKEHTDNMGMKTTKADARAVAEIMPSKAALAMPGMNSIRGTVTFLQYGDEVEVSAIVQGLPKNSTHGFHVHEKGDLSAADLTSVGGHWDPAMHKHHGAPGMENHAGDLGNLVADENGVAKLTVRTKAFSLTGEPSVLGHALIIHAGQDDLMSQPAGNSGARIAGGVVMKQ